jgi:anti-sigma B factor antagonist
VAVVALRGKITLGEASQNLRNQVDELVSGGKSQIVLNLADVPFIDSAGLGALTVGYTRTKAAGGLLKIAAVQPRVRDALEMTRLTRMFTLYATVQEAIESFAVGA